MHCHLLLLTRKSNSVFCRVGLLIGKSAAYYIYAHCLSCHVKLFVFVTFCAAILSTAIRMVHIVYSNFNRIDIVVVAAGPRLPFYGSVTSLAYPSGRAPHYHALMCDSDIIIVALRGLT